jgi:hypothetical protein
VAAAPRLGLLLVSQAQGVPYHFSREPLGRTNHECSSTRTASVVQDLFGIVAGFFRSSPNSPSMKNPQPNAEGFSALRTPRWEFARLDLNDANRGSPGESYNPSLR